MTVAIGLPPAPAWTSVDESSLLGTTVVARLLDDRILRGLLVEFDASQARVALRIDPQGEVHTVPFAQLRYLSFMRPATVAPDAQPPAAGDSEHIVIPQNAQPFHLTYNDGKIVKGNMCAAEVDKYGVHGFQSKDSANIVRVFVPLGVLRKYWIAPRTGEIVASANAQDRVGDAVEAALLADTREELAALLDHHGTPPGKTRQRLLDELLKTGSEQLRAALERQKHDRSRKVGDILTVSDATDAEHLAQSLELQSREQHGHIGEILKELDTADTTSAQRPGSNKKLDRVVHEMGIAHPEGLYIALAQKFGMPFVQLRNFDIDAQALAFVPEYIAVDNGLMPLFLHDNHLVLAVSDPANREALDLVRFISRHNVELSIATPADIHQAIVKHYHSREEEKILDELDEYGPDEEFNEKDVLRAEQLSNEKPIVRLVDNIIADAVRRGASDIHIHPEEDHVALVLRVDGEMTHVRSFPRRLLPPVVSRVKILGGMNIAERRLPQDGRYRVTSRDKVVDLRISIMPTIYGESVVIRLLNGSGELKTVRQLGFSDHDLSRVIDLLNKSYGMLLVTGPTGSGKSTTLYAALQEVKKQGVNILTIEDPVEYRLAGIEQMQVHASIGFTFARALRNILRHDPDVIMVGEIRDQETGKIAVESALTGHLVLSTLHTNDAAGAVTRLMEMGIEPYLVNSSVLGVLAQRLVKRNCPQCVSPEEVDANTRAALGVSADEVFYRGKGCDHCNSTGYKGRLAVYEMLQMSPALRAIITEGVTAEDIRALALKEGMVLLTDHALTLARQRTTSLAEVYRVRLN